MSTPPIRIFPDSEACGFDFPNPYLKRVIRDACKQVRISLVTSTPIDKQSLSIALAAAELYALILPQ